MTGSAATVRSRLLGGLVVCAVTATLCACGAGSPTTATTTAPSTTTTSADPSAEVLTAYLGMWADLVTAARTSDYQSPLLAEHATGQARTLFVQGLAWDQLHGIVTRGEPVLDPSVTSLSPTGDPTRATVSDCFDDTHWVEELSSGRPAKNAPAGRRATTADLVKTSGGWKVSQITIEATGTC